MTLQRLPKREIIISLQAIGVERIPGKGLFFIQLDGIDKGLVSNLGIVVFIAGQAFDFMHHIHA